MVEKPHRTLENLRIMVIMHFHACRYCDLGLHGHIFFPDSLPATTHRLHAQGRQIKIACAAVNVTFGKSEIEQK